MQEIEWESLFGMFLDCIFSFIRMAYARESPEGFQDGGILAEFTKRRYFRAHKKRRNCPTLNFSVIHQDKFYKLKMLTRTRNILNNIPTRF